MSQLFKIEWSGGTITPKLVSSLVRDYLTFQGGTVVVEELVPRLVYLLFAGCEYELVGGAKDFAGVFKTLEEAQEAGSLTFRGAWGDPWAHVAIWEDDMLHIVSMNHLLGGGGWCEPAYYETEKEKANG